MADEYPKQFFEETGSVGFVQPYLLQSGNMRGTQTVGFGNTKIDSANNRIIITNSVDNSQIGIGTVPGSTTGEFGFFSLDSNSNLIMKIVGPTQFVYDLTTNKNIIQIGRLPDGSYGMAVAKSGFNVSDGIS
jgi:hypothetical protein